MHPANRVARSHKSSLTRLDTALIPCSPERRSLLNTRVSFDNTLRNKRLSVMSSVCCCSNAGESGHGAGQV